MTLSRAAALELDSLRERDESTLRNGRLPPSMLIARKSGEQGAIDCAWSESNGAARKFPQGIGEASGLVARLATRLLDESCKACNVASDSNASGARPSRSSSARLGTALLFGCVSGLVKDAVGAAAWDDKGNDSGVGASSARLAEAGLPSFSRLPMSLRRPETRLLRFLVCFRTRALGWFAGGSEVLVDDAARDAVCEQGEQGITGEPDLLAIERRAWLMFAVAKLFSAARRVRIGEAGSKW